MTDKVTYVQALKHDFYKLRLTIDKFKVHVCDCCVVLFLQWSTEWFIVVGMGRNVGASTSNIVLTSTLTLPLGDCQSSSLPLATRLKRRLALAVVTSTQAEFRGSPPLLLSDDTSEDNT